MTNHPETLTDVLVADRDDERVLLPGDPDRPAPYTPDEPDPDGDTFLGTVDPAGIWGRAAAAVEAALTLTRERLTEARAEKERNRLEIRDLVAEEQLLARMWRIAESRQQAIDDAPNES